MLYEEKLENRYLYKRLFAHDQTSNTKKGKNHNFISNHKNQNTEQFSLISNYNN